MNLEKLCELRRSLMGGEGGVCDVHSWEERYDNKALIRC